MQFGPSSHNPDPKRAPLDPHTAPAANQAVALSTLMRLPLEYAMRAAGEAARDFELDHSWHEASCMAEQGYKIALTLYPAGGPAVVRQLLSLSNYQTLAREFSKAEHTLHEVATSLDRQSIDAETRERSMILMQYQKTLLQAKRSNKVNYVELARGANSENLNAESRIIAWSALLKLSNDFGLNNLALTVQSKGVTWAEGHFRGPPAPIGALSEEAQRSVLKFLRGCIRSERDLSARIRKTEDLLRKAQSLPAITQAAATDAARRLTLDLVEDYMLAREPLRAEELANQLVQSALTLTPLEPWLLRGPIQALAEVIEQRYGIKPARERLKDIGELPQIRCARARIALIPKLVETQLLFNHKQPEQSLQVLIQAIKECKGSDYESSYARFRIAHNIADIAKFSGNSELCSRFRELTFEYAKKLCGENDPITLFAWSRAVEEAFESKELGAAKLYLDAAPSSMLRADSDTLPAHLRVILSRSKGALALEGNNPVDAVPFLEEAMRLCRGCEGLENAEILYTLEILIHGVEARLRLLQDQLDEVVDDERHKLLDLYEEQMVYLESQPHPSEDKIIKSLRRQIALLDRLNFDPHRRMKLLGKLQNLDPHARPSSSDRPRDAQDAGNEEDEWDD